ncbi:hypothetical protein NP590_01400 [Methylomonas sp. SURF-2]|uniref:Uncharacterized protein n=1 Tax=Methylomonas subterranea TaxID=2952225 RepID=A0ABT1TBR2_9GAMM|nr:hypothetical protein [Methylomonas sp. SURF-2]MCQ8102744.1 hypothetical protein [Methylomonas sp. SURF-2]
MQANPGGLAYKKLIKQWVLPVVGECGWRGLVFAATAILGNGLEAPLGRADGFWNY